MKCKNCNYESNNSSSTFCYNCGAKLESAFAAPQTPKKGIGPLAITLIIVDSILLVAGVGFAIYFGLFSSLFSSGKGSHNVNGSAAALENAAGNGSAIYQILAFTAGTDISIPSLNAGNNQGNNAAAPRPDDTAAADAETAHTETRPAETEPPTPETAAPETAAPETTAPETTAPAPVWEGSSRVVIANGGLNMRSSPSLSAGIINCIPNGNIITVEKVQDNWAYVYFGGGYGWCSCDYLFLPLEYSGTPIHRATVRCYDKVEMVSEGYAENDLVYTDIFNGTVVDVYEIDGNRAFVKYNNIYGWCDKSYLEMY